MNKFKHIVALIFVSHCWIVIGHAQGSKANTFSITARNNFAPNLYSETLDFRTTLVNLPGAHMRASQWQISYEIYFVSEVDFDNTIQKIRRREPIPGDFSDKILLVSGNFNKKLLQKSSERIVEKNGIIFKAKIPNPSKTEFAKLITFFTVRIYDAKLRKNIYKSSLFISPPFTQTGSKKEPLRKLFLNFFVNSEGKLYTSKEERGKTDTDW